jgi:AcrR family transcriptional regulator
MSTVVEPEEGTETEGTRERLLDATIRLAGTIGPDRVTYRAVGAEAGVAHSLVRFYFGTREALLTEAFERAARRDAQDATLLANDVHSFGSHFVSTMHQDRTRQLIQYDFLLRAVRGGGPTEPVAQLYDHYIAQVSGTLENLGIEDPTESVAALVFAALDGLVLQHFIYGSDERTERILGELRRVLTAFTGRA